MEFNAGPTYTVPILRLFPFRKILRHYVIEYSFSDLVESSTVNDRGVGAEARWRKRLDSRSNKQRQTAPFLPTWTGKPELDRLFPSCLSLTMKDTTINDDEKVFHATNTINDEVGDDIVPPSPAPRSPLAGRNVVHHRPTIDEEKGAPHCLF